MINYTYIFCAFLCSFYCNSFNELSAAVINGSSSQVPKQLEMVLIKARSSPFLMGSDNGNPSEQPSHTVALTYDYWMAVTEVTQADYQSVMINCYPDYTEPYWVEPFGVGDKYPAYLVEWGDAVLFCNALSKKEGLDTVYTYKAIIGRPGGGCSLKDVVTNYNLSGYRLPTEAEWEFACKAGTESDFYWGVNYNPFTPNERGVSAVDMNAVWAGNSYKLGAGNKMYGPAEVASKNSNLFGLFDMAGNVSEWVNDWYADYSPYVQIDPRGGTDETYHFVRGGNWSSDVKDLRSSSRHFSSPEHYMYFIGFRVVLPVMEQRIKLFEEIKRSK